MARPGYYLDPEANTKADAYKVRGVPVMDGRHRAHASQQGNALLAVIRLGLVDDRAPRLVERLLQWQWTDGGWNCDKDPAADTSSFMESLPPMPALAAWAARTGDVVAAGAADRATEVFLERRLLDLLVSKRLPDGGWPAEAKYYTQSRTVALGNDDVDWGGTSRRRSNPWVTVDALAILRASGRLVVYGVGQSVPWVTADRTT